MKKIGAILLNFCCFFLLWFVNKFYTLLLFYNAQGQTFIWAFYK